MQRHAAEALGFIPDLLRGTLALKNVILELRRQMALSLRTSRDFSSGVRRRFASWQQTGRKSADNFPPHLTLEQPISPTESVAAKIHNIELALRVIENLPIPPGGVFSFWHLVGRPTPSRDFRVGRSLLGGQLRADYGGGLCQLSGIIYHASLLAGLQILERHAHSRDIYDDTTRYTPPGADATVAYGFKDLRLANSLSAPMCYRFNLSPDRLTCWICCPEPIQPCRVEFSVRSPESCMSVVETRRQRLGDSKVEILAVSSYRKPTQT